LKFFEHIETDRRIEFVSVHDEGAIFYFAVSFSCSGSSKSPGMYDDKMIRRIRSCKTVEEYTGWFIKGSFVMLVMIFVFLGQFYQQGEGSGLR